MWKNLFLNLASFGQLIIHHLLFSFPSNAHELKRKCISPRCKEDSLKRITIQFKFRYQQNIYTWRLQQYINYRDKQSFFLGFSASKTQLLTKFTSYWIKPFSSKTLIDDPEKRDFHKQQSMNIFYERILSIILTCFQATLKIMLDFLQWCSCNCKLQL